MRLTKGKKLFFGFVSTWPVLYPLVAVGMTLLPSGRELAIAAFLVHAMMLLVILALIPFYAVLAIRNEELEQPATLLWVLGFVGCAGVAMPAYYWKYVWPLPTIAERWDR